MFNNFEFEKTNIDGVYKIHPFFSEDIRGNFIKDYAAEIFESNGIEYNLKEVFYTNSHKGVIRALHFQRVKQQPKLVRCILGEVFDVVVDLRKNSRTFKQWLSFDLNQKNNYELLIPAGCAHGYLVIKHSIVSYKCAEKFYSEFDDGIIWNDPDIAINWPLEIVQGKIILSEKDKNLQSFNNFILNYGGL